MIAGPFQLELFYSILRYMKPYFEGTHNALINYNFELSVDGESDD